MNALACATPSGVILLRRGPWAAWVLPWGARLMQLWWLTAPEGPRPLTLGFANPAAYAQDRMAIGAVCGRYANRIGGARLQRDHQSWALAVNHPMGHCIHGGPAGFGVTPWRVVQVSADSVVLERDSPNGDQGFPGRCIARVEYRLRDDGLDWIANAEVDAPCPINLVQHSYWNLKGSGDLSSHRLSVPAAQYLPVGPDELPQDPSPVAGTVFDFQRSRSIPLSDVPHLDAALRLDSALGANGLRHAAHLAVDDLELTVYTDRPLLHLYAGAGLSAGATALGATHRPGAGLCLETEDWPNGPALGRVAWTEPGQTYLHRMQVHLHPIC